MLYVCVCFVSCCVLDSSIFWLLVWISIGGKLCRLVLSGLCVVVDFVL